MPWRGSSLEWVMLSSSVDGGCDARRHGATLARLGAAVDRLNPFEAGKASVSSGPPERLGAIVGRLLRKKADVLEPGGIGHQAAEGLPALPRSEEPTSELQSLMR